MNAVAEAVPHSTSHSFKRLEFNCVILSSVHFEATGESSGRNTKFVMNDPVHNEQAADSDVSGQTVARMPRIESTVRSRPTMVSGRVLR